MDSDKDGSESSPTLEKKPETGMTIKKNRFRRYNSKNNHNLTKLEVGGGGKDLLTWPLWVELFLRLPNLMQIRNYSNPEPQACLQPPLRYSKYNYIRINSI